MRLYSTPESAKAREVSALAIIETSIAIAVTFFIAYRHETVLHIAIGAFLAPKRPIAHSR
jgi:hypothetical protein